MHGRVPGCHGQGGEEKQEQRHQQMAEVVRIATDKDKCQGFASIVAALTANIHDDDCYNRKL